MIHLTPATIESSIENARKSNLLVRRTATFRVYTVTNRENGHTYEVTFSVHNGNKFADCTCSAAQWGRACKHVAAAAGLHVMIAAESQATSH